MTAADGTAAGNTLDYHAMRLRWCRLALQRFLRRWGVYMGVAALVVGAGANSPVHAVAGVAAWLVVPLLYASSKGAWLLPAVAAQALAATGCVWGLRGLLWPARWAEAERALPISKRQRVHSDGVVVALALLPLGLLQVAGVSAVLASRPAWLQPTQTLALGALVLANLSAWGLGVLLLQGLRRPPSLRRLRAVPVARGRVHAAWPWALLWLPLWRGPARRTGHLLLLGSALLSLPGALTWVWPGGLPWWLALGAVAALVLVTRAHALVREETGALFDACVMLPLSPPVLQRARAALCLLPLLPAGMALAAGLLHAVVRPAVLAAYVLASLGSCVVEVLSRPAEPADKASRWLFSLVLCIALASEVLP